MDVDKVEKTLGLRNTRQFQSSQEFVTYCRGQAQAEHGFVSKTYEFVWTNSDSYVSDIQQTMGICKALLACSMSRFVNYCESLAQRSKAFDDAVYKVVWQISGDEPQKVAELFGTVSTPRDHNEFKYLFQNFPACEDAVYTSLWNFMNGDLGHVAQILALSDFATVPKSCDQFLTHCRSLPMDRREPLLKQAWCNCDAAKSIPALRGGS